MELFLLYMCIIPNEKAIQTMKTKILLMAFALFFGACSNHPMDPKVEFAIKGTGYFFHTSFLFRSPTISKRWQKPVL
jgi:hypothetical protein